MIEGAYLVPQVSPIKNYADVDRQGTRVVVGADSAYDLLLSPYLSHDAPTTRADSGGWVSAGIPRIVGIGLLNQVGIH